jgi:hypothetical protein
LLADLLLVLIHFLQLEHDQLDVHLFEFIQRLRDLSGLPGAARGPDRLTKRLPNEVGGSGNTVLRGSQLLLLLLL